MPGMAEYLLTCNKEDLLHDSARFTKQYFGDICKADGEPTETWIDAAYPNPGDEAERKRLSKGAMDHYEIHCNIRGDVPSSMKICFAYYNLIVAAAVQSPPASTSIGDGYGNLRLDPNEDDVSMAIAALRRAMQLWKDNFVRRSCGDALAPAASLALTAMKEFIQYGMKDYHPKHHLVDQLERCELIPGLDIAEFVCTTLSEFKEMAASSIYSGQCLEYLSKSLMIPFVGKKWDQLSVEKRAETVLAIISHILNDGPAYHKGDSPRPGRAVPGALIKILDHACGIDKTVLKVAAENEFLGPENPGRNVSVRGIVNYCLRNFDQLQVRGRHIVAAYKIWQSVPYSEDEITDVTVRRNYDEKKMCYSMAEKTLGIRKSV